LEDGEMILELVVNNVAWVLDVDPRWRLLDVLRDKLGLTGTKECCGEGECGACTVIMDGLAVNACLVFAHQARGKEIITVEALAHDQQLDRLQESFIKNGAVQCGYCTPGMLMSCKALMMKNPEPTEVEVRRAIEGNLCRCTGYTSIVRAVKDVQTSR
jgi:carbon-monoxide dehydrogenase small subunit